MISIYSILTVARFEAKTLWRSWFFRIFSILSIAFIGFFDFMALTPAVWSPWGFQGVPTTIPYMNVLLLNTAQAVIAVFLASDFLKRDKKLDTTEVVYMRSMTNSDYVAGKTLGIMLMFLLLNIVILLIGFVFNVFFSETTFGGVAYLIYPLVLSLPTLVFILGFAFLMMVTIRNQAVTFIVLLGYIGITVFYLGPKVDSVFDYIAFSVPMVYSQMSGFADVWRLLAQRSIYLFLGLAFIFTTALMIRRLPQSRAMSGLARIAAAACMAAAVASAVYYTAGGHSARALRERMKEAAEAAGSDAVATPLSCAIDLRHEGTTIDATAAMSVRNDSGAPLALYLMNLNPGLDVLEVSGPRGPFGYERREHLLTISPPKPLLPGAVDSFRISYRGKIDEDAMYIDVSEETLESRNSVTFFNVGRRCSYLQPAYVLLTPEAMWYPAAGPGFVPSRPLERPRYFVDFSLDVSTSPGLTALSQGTMRTPSPGRFSFRPEHPLPAISLAVAEYERKSVTVDSLEYSIYYAEGHDYWSRYFTEVGDTLEAMIRDLRQSYENNLDLEYPFPRFSIVEVPVHYSAFYHAWSLSQETVQPEMVLIPEKGVTIRSADFKRMTQRTERMNDRSNEEISATENQARMLALFVNGTLTSSFGMPDWREGDPFKRTPSYNVFPNMLSFRNVVDSEDMPWLGMALESWYAARLEGERSGFTRVVFGMTADERINLKLSEMSLHQLVLDPEYREMSHFALRSKGNFLFRMIESRADRDELDKTFDELFERYGHGRIPGAVFEETLRERFGIDLSAIAGSWYDGIELSGFIVSPVTIYKFIDGERERYQVRFNVTNSGDADGLLDVTLRQMDLNVGGGRRFGGMMRMMTATMTMGDDFQRYVPVQSGKTKELGFVLDFQPSSVLINTLISKNLPAVLDIDLPEQTEEKKRIEPFDGERSRVDPVRISIEGETVVDNEDPGFEYSSGTSKSLLKRLIPRAAPATDVKYVGMRMWNESNSWQPTIDSKFYGSTIRSAHFISGGKGDMRASFTASLDRSGHYDIYFYVSKISSHWRRHRQEEENYGKYDIIIHHDDGIEQTELDLNGADDGWNYLGSYYISEGEAKIELTNKSEGQFVIADAVKWVAR